MMPGQNRTVIKMIIIEPQGKEHCLCIDASEFPIFSERQVEEIVDPIYPGINSFRDVVNVLQKREYRKDLLKDAAILLSTRLAEHLEDKEGWNGVGRRERLKELDR